METYLVSDHTLLYTYIPFIHNRKINLAPPHTTKPTIPRHHPPPEPRRTKPPYIHATHPLEDKQEDQDAASKDHEEAQDEPEDRKERHEWVDGECVA